METNEGKNTKNELKIIIIGNSNTGKTSFVKKLIKKIYLLIKVTVIS